MIAARSLLVPIALLVVSISACASGNAPVGPIIVSRRGQLTASGLPKGIQTINGWMFGNLPFAALTIRPGQHVRWYLISGINADDFHARRVPDEHVEPAFPDFKPF